MVLVKGPRKGPEMASVRVLGKVLTLASTRGLPMSMEMVQSKVAVVD